MSTQEYSPRRSRATRKPPVQCPQVNFYRCNCCGAVCQKVSRQQSNINMHCCGQVMQQLVAVDAKDMPPEIELHYKITGGYNNNAVQVFWALQAPYQLEWLYLKTYSGGYMKYVAQSKKPPMVFALADEDAFSYCDEDPCLECVFWCKRGFAVYGYIQGKGLFELVLNKATAYWQSGAK